MAVDRLIELRDVDKNYGEGEVLGVPARCAGDRAPDEFFTGPRGRRARDFLSKILQH
ncbi:hypothetical protein ACFV29_10175 [Streptomyces sp. NPDC059690]|uniref:hypothetical protein n=1 Tax=Streptomyces sp. NPDC059690 TaxID=3346907 RepID=UPI0036A771D8